MNQPMRIIDLNDRKQFQEDSCQSIDLRFVFLTPFCQVFDDPTGEVTVNQQGNHRKYGKQRQIPTLKKQKNYGNNKRSKLLHKRKKIFI